MTHPDYDKAWQQHLEQLRATNTAFTLESSELGENAVRGDFRSFDLQTMNREVSQSRLGRNILEETTRELKIDPFFSSLIELGPYLANSAKTQENLVRISPPRHWNEHDWTKDRKRMEKRGTSNDRIRQASLYGLKTLVTRLMSDRPTDLNKTLELLENMIVMERDSGGSRGGITSDGPLVIFNLGLEHGKYDWMAEFMESEMSTDSEYILGISTLAHEGGHILDGSRRYVQDFGTPSSRYSIDIDTTQSDIPIKWSNSFGSDTLNLSRREMFAEGIANQVMNELGLDNSVVRDYRLLYYAWSVAHFNLISPTDMSTIFENAQHLMTNGGINEATFDKISSIYEMTSGHPIAVNYPLDEAHLNTLLHI